MKTLTFLESAACCLALVCGAAVGRCQEFRNLDFELAQPPVNDPLFGPMSLLLPYWQGGYGEVGYNFIGLDVSQLGLYGGGGSFFPAPLQGNYSAFLKAATENPALSYPGVSLFQTGRIPSDSRSVRFSTTREFRFSGGTGTLTLNLNGYTLSYMPLESGPDYITWGADVSSFAGTVAEMRFSLWADPPVRYNEPAIGLDNIQFSPMEIPEPGSMALIGGWLLAVWLFRRSSASKAESARTG